MEEKIKFITILGNVWKIEFKELGDAQEDAYTECDVRTITVRTDNNGQWKDFDRMRRQWLRHEIIHAFHFECGLGYNYEHKSIGVDETTVDWFAIQYPKMKKIFEELECED